MKFIRLLFLFSIAAMSGSQATDMLGGNDPFEKRYILDSKKLPEQKIQAAMRQSPVWKSFLQNNGTWYVVFDELTGMPHRASGKPISVSAMNFRDAALVFINDQLGGYGVPQQDLKFQTENFSGKYHNVFFTQKYQGLDILNSRAFVKLTPDMKVSTFGLDVFKVEDLSTQPSIPLTMINSFATKDLSLSVTNISTATLKVLPLPVNGSYEYRLVYELTVSTIDESKIPGQYYSLLDANTGELLYRQNKVRFSHPLNTDIAVSGTVSLYSPFQPTQVMPMRNLKVDDGSNLFNTDSMGEVSLTGASSITATFSLEGFWSQIFTDAGFVTPSIAATFDPGQGMLSFDSVTTLSHVSGYYHVNVIHDFMKSFFPTFTTMDFPLPTRIDVTGGSCNAYYSGSEISFFEASGGCNSMAEIGDIVYHEYGHGINDLFYQWQGSNWQNGGMGEGYADVWGFSITQNPVLGPGFQSASSFIRRYNVNKKVYPQDLTGEVHDDGEIIAGAWYDVSLNIGSWANMTSLFASTYYDLITGPDGDEGRIYTDILLSALNHDDNDADLSNGTPNDSAILAAFELHGISLLNNVNLSHDDVLTASALAPIVIDASMTSQYPW
ncbi:MAG: hypothetical protein KA444_05390, partial [Bacteroidia bacterium]|nr:hypothetical protein [Bacteroidia bacterium]